MRRLVLLLIPIAAVSSAAYDDDRGPGIAGQRQGNALVYPVSGFDAVGLGTAADVEVKVGPAWSVRATGPAAAFADFRIARDRDSLVIGRRYRHRDGDQALERRIHVYVTMPRIADAAIGGSGTVRVDRVAGDRFVAAVGGSGTLAIGALDARQARVSIGGSGGVTARGRVAALDVSVGGSGHFDGAGLRAGRATISVGGSGSVRAAVEGPAQVSMAGSGDVDLGPAARCTTSRVGGGRVRCGG